jgi:hypothetical protein
MLSCAPLVSLGSKAESLRNGRMSAFASSSGHTSARAFSSFVPIAVVSRCSKESQTYSMTSSARASSVSGTVRPSALAVLRLITNSIFVENSIGKSAGFAPFRIFSTKAAA